MFNAVGYYAQPQRLDFEHGLLTRASVGQHAWQLKHLCDPASIFFLFTFYRESHPVDSVLQFWAKVNLLLPQGFRTGRTGL